MRTSSLVFRSDATCLSRCQIVSGTVPLAEPRRMEGVTEELSGKRPDYAIASLFNQHSTIAMLVKSSIGFSTAFRASDAVDVKGA